jgi:hypothetical protein
MRKRGALFASLSATVIGLSTLWSGVVVAANKCITEPKLQSAQGTHWYYHVDPVSHRKCWYVGRQKVPQAAPPESRSSPKPKSDDENLTPTWHAVR